MNQFTEEELHPLIIKQEDYEDARRTLKKMNQEREELIRRVQQLEWEMDLWAIRMQVYNGYKTVMEEKNSLIRKQVEVLDEVERMYQQERVKELKRPNANIDEVDFGIEQ